MPEDIRLAEMTAQQRAARITWWLAHGESITTADVARLSGLSWDGAYKMMCNLSGAIPIYCDKGTWQVCAMQETADCIISI